MLRTALPAALALTLTACGGYSPSDIDPEARGLSMGDATLEHVELSLDAQGAEVELFFASPAGCPVVPSTFVAQLNGQALAVQESGHFGWVTRPTCTPGTENQGTACEGTTLTLGCDAPKATVLLPRSAALVDGTLELQVGDTRFSYPVSLSTLAWHVVPTADGGARMSWGGPVEPTTTKAVVQSGRAALTSSAGEMVLPRGTSTEPSQVVVVVTSVVVSAPGAPRLNVTVRQVLAVP